MMQYKVKPLSVSDKEAFTEASREELRALIVIIERDGQISGAEELAKIAGISKARAVSSLALWEEAGVIKRMTDAPTITEEFEARLDAGEIQEETAVNVARSIRASKLADMISECAVLLGRAALNTSEIKQITALHEQYALSAEYIVTLAAYMAERGKLTVTRLVNKAIDLSSRDIDSLKTLESYIIERESESEAEREFRKLFGIYGRAPSKTEKECFKKWSKDFGYFTDVVGEAYDIAVTNATRGHLSYADKLLTRWYDTGCRTLSECKQRYEADEAEKKAAKASEKHTAKKDTKREGERYGAFDANDALMKALERSYGKKD